MDSGHENSALAEAIPSRSSPAPDTNHRLRDDPVPLQNGLDAVGRAKSQDHRDPGPKNHDSNHDADDDCACGHTLHSFS